MTKQRVFLFFIYLELGRQLLKFTRFVPIPTAMVYLLQFGSVGSSLICGLKNKRLFNPIFIPLWLWLIWTIISIFRSFFAVEIYWDLKALLSNIPCLFLPVFCLVFDDQRFTSSFLRKWNYLFIVHIALLLLGIVEKENAHLLLGAGYFLYASFFFLIPKMRWKAIVLVLLAIMLSDIDARSQVIKAIAVTAVGIASLFSGPFIKWVARIGSVSLYPLAIVLLILGITGEFNIFDHEDHSFDNITRIVDGRVVEKEITGGPDTRTFIYVDVIYSALKNDYVWFGRTPARGNDGDVFFAHMGTGELEPDMRLERYKNELCHLNIFTWMGLVGVFLYSIIYLQASILSLFFSNNRYMILLGGLTAFNWFYGWVENCNNFDMMDLAIWMIIGMCISKKFRKMSDTEFSLWFKSIFDKNDLVKYDRFFVVKKMLYYKSILKVKLS